MIKIGCISTSEYKVLYDGVEIQRPYKIDPVVGEHTIEIFCNTADIAYIQVFNQLLDRKKAIKTKNGNMFVFDIIDSHANFSKHTGNFGTLMLRKDRIKI